MPNRIVHACTDRSARGIAASVSRLITRGTLAPAERLPTVRLLASELGVSPTTVSEAWSVLVDSGAIVTRGRLGTFVADRTAPNAPRRYRNLSDAGGDFAHDLSTGTPDPALLPDLSAVLAAVSRTARTTSYHDDPVLPELAAVLTGLWPFPPAALTVVDGALDALDRIARELVRLGDRVIVENPTFPPLLDILEQIGAEVVGVPVDDAGIDPAALAEAIAREPVALFTQPRAHNPLGVSATSDRVEALAEILTGTGIAVVEDDHAGDIANAPLASLGEHLPDDTILVRSYSKSHGPDLRLAAVGGARDPILRVARRRMLGPGWSSRLLQAVLAALLTDDDTIATVGAARTEYARRRAAFSEVLTRHGFAVSGTDGINLWVAVPDERTAQLALAARGFAAAPGAPFLVSPLESDHLRLTLSVAGDMHALAEDVASALAPSQPGPRC